MAAAVRESVKLAGRPGQVREARAFVARLLGPSHPFVEVAVLLASELLTNSVRHVGSAVRGEVVAYCDRLLAPSAGGRSRSADGCSPVPIAGGALGSDGTRLKEKAATAASSAAKMNRPR